MKYKVEYFTLRFSLFKHTQTITEIMTQSELAQLLRDEMVGLISAESVLLDEVSLLDELLLDEVASYE